MKADFLIVQVCALLDDGDGFYRFHEPSRQLSRLPGVVVVDCHHGHRFLPLLMEAADVLVLSSMDWDFFPLIEQRHLAGRATAFEANDYFFDIHPWNPAAAHWQDRSIHAEFRYFLAAADGVQSSTSELARRWAPYSRRVLVLKNQLTDIPPLTAPPARPLTIGWGGSPGHFADWYALAPTLQKWLNAHPDVHVAVMTDKFAHSFLQLPPQRYHFTQFGSLAEYLKFLPSLDIGLAPLLPTDYNRCRSDVKFIEYASRGIAGIYADLEPYRESVMPGQTGLIYKTLEEFLRCLDQLASDAALRGRIRQQAYDHVTKNRRIADHIGERLAFYRGLLPGPPRGFELPGQVLAAGICDGRYVQLRPQTPEDLLSAVTQSPPRKDASQALARMLEQHPTYLAALQQQARLLNDLREYQAALFHAERALAINPRSTSALCERGRARFGLKDIAGARQSFEASLAVNPVYYPGWQYLLALLSLHKSPDGPSLARRALEHYPECYSLGLAGAQTYPDLEGLKETHRLLELFAPTFTSQEKPEAAATFSRAITKMAGTLIRVPEGLAFLRRACEVFPNSARLATFLAQALHLAGQEDESLQAYLRALAIYQTASTYRTEFPKDDETVRYWQIAQSIQERRG